MNNQEKESFNELQEVEKALQPYIESAKTGDGIMGRSVFFAHAHVVGSIDGNFNNVDADAYGETLSSMGASKNVQHHIAWIDISGPAAVAKIEFIDWLGFRFTDYLALYKQDNQWKISAKVYDSHSRN